MHDLKTEITAFLTDEATRPVSIKELIRAFGVPRDERDAFKSFVKSMVADGTLMKIQGGRYGLPSKMNLINGTITCNPSGFGFVIPDEGGDDLFIDRRRLKGAMHGDKVVARVERLKRDGKKEGSIIRITDRAVKSLVGRFTRSKGFSLVIPSNERILDDIIIPPRMAGGAKDGQIVVAEITRWPAERQAPSGKVTEILGDPDDPDVEIEVLVRKFNLPLLFPTDVQKAAEAVPDTVSEAEIKGRTDLRGKTLVTIDGETAKDFDDAVGVKKDDDGFTLYVSIADVSHYVTPGSALDTEAYERSTSVYFPDRCVPMLPERLSNGICSLNPKVDRLTMTAELSFNSSGEVTKRKFYKSIIRSKERLTYTVVNHILNGDELATKRYSNVARDILLMGELATLLAEGRKREGSIDFDLPEPQIIIDIEGQIEDIVRSERNAAHRLIEEFMLAANKAVALEFSRPELPFIYRIHAEPNAEKITDFMEFIAAFGCVGPPRSKGPGGLHKYFQAVLKDFEDKPAERLVNHVLLRSMQKAEYSASNTGHFGLAFTDYTHFTSPIRRYPDLIVHRLLTKFLTKKYDSKLQEEYAARLPVVATHTSAMERRAMEAEREITDLKKAQFMKDKVGNTYDGFVSGVTGFGVFVELTEYFVEGLVHITTLLDDYYIFMEKEHYLIGENTKRVFRVGDPVKIVIKSVDLALRRIEMALAEEKKPSKKPGEKKRANGGYKKKASADRKRGGKGKRR